MAGNPRKLGILKISRDFRDLTKELEKKIVVHYFLLLKITIIIYFLLNLFFLIIIENYLKNSTSIFRS